jgi:hypothetical protein
MRRNIRLAIPTACSFWLLTTLANAQPKPTVVAILHANILDVRTGAMQLDSDVLISADRIAAIGRSGTLQIPKNARRLDARNKFLIPGLWDMHVHMMWRNEVSFYAPLFIANGVTGVRDMGCPLGDLDLLPHWRQQIAEGKLVGPRIFALGPQLDGPPPIHPEFYAGSSSYVLHSPDEARQAVRLLKEKGVSEVKVYTLLPRDIYFAIADESKKQSLSFAGHVPLAIRWQEASEAGQKSVEHLLGLLLACSSRESEFLAAGKPSYAVDQEILESFDDKKAATLFELLHRNGTWQCPTLFEGVQISRAAEIDALHDPRFQYMPQSTREGWEAKLTELRKLPQIPASAREAFKVLAREKLILPMLHSGVRFLAGTDSGTVFSYPGFSLHEELQILTSFGFTPLQSLQTATINPAEYFGIEKDAGTLEPGKFADALLLDANPLEDISNTKKIFAVVASGGLFTRSDLDKLLADEAIEVQKDLVSRSSALHRREPFSVMPRSGVPRRTIEISSKRPASRLGHSVLWEDHRDLALIVSE